jgi:hypothetical protein
MRGLVKAAGGDPRAAGPSRSSSGLSATKSLSWELSRAGEQRGPSDDKGGGNNMIPAIPLNTPPPGQIATEIHNQRAFRD